MVQREDIASLCDALAALIEERFPEAARSLDALLPVLRRADGSAAQREVVEETFPYALVAAGRSAAARHLMETRLERKQALWDLRSRAGLEV